MVIRMKVIDGSLVVRPAGDLTEAAALELHQQIEQELSPAPRDVVLNLKGIDTFSVGALPYLFRIQKQARQADNRFVFEGAPEGALRLFQLTNVASRLEIVQSEEDALRAPVA